MKFRLLLALCAAVLTASVFVGSAAADPPTTDEFSVVGDQFACGDTILTIRTGTVTERTHVHRLKNGLFRVIMTSVPRGVTATVEGVPLEEATVYRIVGVGHANFTTSNPDVEGNEVSGFFRIKLNIVGPGGLFGNVDFRVRGKNGEEIERDRGTCQFVEP